MLTNISKNDIRVLREYMEICDRFYNRLVELGLIEADNRNWVVDVIKKEIEKQGLDVNTSYIITLGERLVNDIYKAPNDNNILIEKGISGIVADTYEMYIRCNRSKGL